MINRNMSATARVILYFILVGMMFLGIGIYCMSLLPERYFAFDGEDELNIDVFYPLTSSVVNDNGNYSVDIRLLGIVPLKNISVEFLDASSLIAGGETFGVRLFTDGVIVVGLSSVGETSPAFDGGVRVGDIIIKANGEGELTNEKFAKIVKECGGNKINLSIKRGNITADVSVLPLADESGVYRIGCYVKDSTAGIGTITYIDPATGIFAGLGHGIYESETGELMPLRLGQVVGADIFAVERGAEGRPGELKGIFNETRKIGTLFSNTEAGVFGQISGSVGSFSGTVYPVGSRNDVETGPATILSTIDESGVREYEIEIIRVYKSALKQTKNMVIEVKDKELIELTGGIVQGMSGSPIIQNGKIIGAVTHVMVNDPLHGYAIFIENMLGQSAS